VTGNNNLSILKCIHSLLAFKWQNYSLFIL
jgi:hypothetical protein